MVKDLHTKLTSDSRIIKLFAFDLGQKRVVIGTDEAGRGCGAGGVFASAVCFKDFSESLEEKLFELNDSKKLSAKKREALFDVIKDNTINSTICVEVEEIERINILNASLKAMRMACENVINQLYPIPDNSDKLMARNILAKNEIMILIDGNKRIWDFNFSQKYVIKGDAKCYSIAAASIIAKVTRDRIMRQWDEIYPQYGFAKHKGYGTAAHIQAIKEYGLCPLHRLSFVKNIVNKD